MVSRRCVVRGSTTIPSPTAARVCLWQSLTVVELLACGCAGQGFWLCTKRLSHGRFSWWPTATTPLCDGLCMGDLNVLLGNGHPDRAQLAPDWRPIRYTGAGPLPWCRRLAGAGMMANTSWRCIGGATQIWQAGIPVHCTRVRNHTGEDTGDVRTMLRGVEQGVLPLANCQLQRALGDIIVERSARLLHQPRERVPMVQHIGNRFAQTTFGLNQALCRLPLQPRLQRRRISARSTFDGRPIRRCAFSCCSWACLSCSYTSLSASTTTALSAGKSSVNSLNCHRA